MQQGKCGLGTTHTVQGLTDGGEIDELGGGEREEVDCYLLRGQLQSQLLVEVRAWRHVQRVLATE